MQFPTPEMFSLKLHRLFEKRGRLFLKRGHVFKKDGHLFWSV
jgi:hypothetical protein